MREVIFFSFPINFPGKAHAVYKLYLGVRCQLGKTDLSVDYTTANTKLQENIFNYDTRTYIVKKVLCHILNCNFGIIKEN